MNHQPKQLALLISLIGLGVSPYAQASVEVHVVDGLPSLLGMRCSEAGAAALPFCGKTPGLVWQAQRSPLDLSGTPGALVLYSAPRNGWSPAAAGDLGEWKPRAQGKPFKITAKSKTRKSASVVTVAAVEPPHAPARKHSGKSRRVRASARIVVTAQVDAQAVQRIESPQVGQASVLPPVTGPSPEAQRLLDNLIAVLSESPALPETAAVEPAPAAKAAPVERVARMQDAHAAQLVDRPEVAVESQSTKVLRNLGAILSDDRDEVGAIRTDAAQSVASTPGVRVPGMLGEISAPETPAVEDGPTRRLRKLAARAAKAEAKAAADAVAVGVVDVMLPLDLPTGAPLPASTAAAVPTELAPMPIGAQAERGKRASPFGDGQVAVAETSLDRVRGGFSVNGLNISFGIERAVYINGSLVTSTSMNVTELGQVAAGRGVTTLDAGTIALIQNGSGNSVATGSLSPATIGTVIQNTLDGQKIQNVTVINATANSLGMFRSLNLQSSLRGAVIDSLRR